MMNIIPNPVIAANMHWLPTFQQQFPQAINKVSITNINNLANFGIDPIYALVKHPDIWVQRYANLKDFGLELGFFSLSVPHNVQVSSLSALHTVHPNHFQMYHVHHSQKFIWAHYN